MINSQLNSISIVEYKNQAHNCHFELLKKVLSTLISSSRPFEAKIGQCGILTHLIINLFCTFCGNQKILKTNLNFVKLCGTGHCTVVAEIPLLVGSDGIYNLFMKWIKRYLLGRIRRCCEFPCRWSRWAPRRRGGRRGGAGGPPYSHPTPGDIVKINFAFRTRVSHSFVVKAQNICDLS